MNFRYLRAVKMVVLLLACLMALEFPVMGQKGKGHGRGHRRDGVVVVGVTPGVPTSSRGRGRNWSPRTRRGRFIRAVVRRNNRNLTPGIPRRRRVRRGYIHRVVH